MLFRISVEGLKARIDVFNHNDPIDPPLTLIQEMNSWCSFTGCGKLTGLIEFTFATEDELTMFLLRWSNATI
jgi:hypothetical protein